MDIPTTRLGLTLLCKKKKKRLLLLKYHFTTNIQICSPLQSGMLVVWAREAKLSIFRSLCVSPRLRMGER